MKVRKGIVFAILASLLIIMVPGSLYADTYTFAGMGDSRYPDVSSGNGQHILFHFDISGVDLSKATSVSLTISANDVDEEQGEIDNVYLIESDSTEHFLGNLSGQNGQDSTTVFAIDPSWLSLGTGNNIRVEPSVGSPGWIVTVHWGQLFIETSETGGTLPDASITDFTITGYDNSGANVVVYTTMTVLARAAGTYDIESNLIDPSTNNLDIQTASVTAASDNQTLTQDLDFTYPKNSITGTYTINGLLFTDTVPPVLLSTANTSFEHEQDTGVTRINEDLEITVQVSGETGTVWVRNHDMTCFRVWINQDNDFEFVFWWEYYNNNWVKIYDMEDNEVFSIDMEKGRARFVADLPDGIYTVKTFHEEGEILQEFIIGKP